jgi:hypothetical protein
MTKTSKLVEANGVRVRIFKRGRRYWLDVYHGESRTRVSAKTSKLEDAKAAAERLATEIARQELLGVTPDTVTLGALFDAYQAHKGKTAEGQWKRAIATRERLFRDILGADRLVVSISQTTVDTFSTTRRARWIERQQARYASECAAAQAKKRQPPPAPDLRPLRDGALDCDFRWLSSVFNWGVKHRTASGQRLLNHNPLHDCKWPREKKENIRRPVASHDRFVRTLDQTDRVDPLGRLRLALIVARYTARRIDAILHLSASDLLLSPERIRAALAAAGHDERLADQMTHGAIRWRQTWDKQGVERITPISLTVRTAIDTYLAAHPRLGEVPLFPADASAREDAPPGPMTRACATNWLRRAEQLADLPKLRGGLWHAYRRLWATERKHLPDVDVAEAGGWTGTKAMKLAYQHATPQGVLAAVMAG